MRYVSHNIESMFKWQTGGMFKQDSGGMFKTSIKDEACLNNHNGRGTF